MYLEVSLALYMEAGKGHTLINSQTEPYDIQEDISLITRATSSSGGRGGSSRGGSSGSKGGYRGGTSTGGGGGSGDSDQSPRTKYIIGFCVGLGVPLILLCLGYIFIRRRRAKAMKSGNIDKPDAAHTSKWNFLPFVRKKQTDKDVDVEAEATT